MLDIIMGLRLHIGNILSTNLHYHFFCKILFILEAIKIFYFGIKKGYGEEIYGSVYWRRLFFLKKNLL